MATSKEFRDYVVEQLSDLGNITCRPMMGEYLLYYKDILFGGIYDERVLVKNVPSNQCFDMSLEIPYTGAKPMYMIEEIENKEYMYQIILATCKSLKPKEKKLFFSFFFEIFRLKMLIFPIKSWKESKTTLTFM